MGRFSGEIFSSFFCYFIIDNITNKVYYKIIKGVSHVKRKKKKPLTNAEKIALLAILVQIVLWLLDKLLK